MSSSVAGSVLVVPRWACNRFPAGGLGRGRRSASPFEEDSFPRNEDCGIRALDVRISCAIACSVLGFSLASCKIGSEGKSARVQQDVPEFIGLVEKKGFPRPHFSIQIALEVPIWLLWLNVGQVLLVGAVRFGRGEERAEEGRGEEEGRTRSVGLGQGRSVRTKE